MKKIVLAIGMVIWIFLDIKSQSLSQTGVIAQYHFNKTNNQDPFMVVDSSGNDNHGKMIGGVYYTTDRFGVGCSAIWFNGDGYISVPNSPSLQQPQRSFSAMVWFKIGNGADFFNQWITILCKSNQIIESFDSPQYRMQATARTVSLNTEFTENFIPQLSYDVWYFYGYTFDGSTFNVYLDGQVVFTLPYSGSLNPNDFPLEIGRDLPGKLEYFYGAMDDLKIYNRALTASEVSILFNDQSEALAGDRCQASKPITLPNKLSIPKDSESNNLKSEDSIAITESNYQNYQILQKIDEKEPYKDVPPIIDEEEVKYQEVIRVKNKRITIAPFDNNREDGDVVSININGNWILDQYELKNKNPQKPFKIPITLQENKSNFLVAKAWTIGKSPPNTMTIDVDDGHEIQSIVINSDIGLSGGIKIICQP